MEPEPRMQMLVASPEFLDFALDRLVLLQRRGMIASFGLAGWIMGRFGRWFSSWFACRKR